MKKSIRLVVTVLTLALSMVVVTACGSKSHTSNQDASKTEIKTIDSNQLSANIGKDNWVIVDTRENDAFNGWKLDGVKRGGHIQGAVDFSAAWLKVDSKDKEDHLKKDLEARGISAEKNVVLYDANGKDAKAVADYLSGKGYKNLYTYDVKQWAEDETKPMEAYENYEMLVPVSWVKDLVDGKNPETYNGNDFKVFEVSWGKEADSPDYLSKGHIKGAVHINTDEVEEGPLWNRLSDDKLIKFAEANGITIDTTVVLYGADTTAAARVGAILKYLGVKDIRLVNGGTSKWESAGYELEKTSNPKVPVEAFGVTEPANKGYIVDLEEAKAILADKEGSRLVDIRSWEEYIGKTSGYDYIKPKGRPAGAAWGHAGTDNSSLADYRNLDNTMISRDQILKMWKEWDITPDKKLSFYCGTGWRAAEVLIYADVMGLKDISLYDGGWNEWSGNTGNPANPIETGEPQK